MNEGNYIAPNLDEGYSPEAIANMESALEEFIVSLLEIKPELANIAVFRGLKLTINGRPRRIGELGNVESPDDPMRIELMIYNKEQIEQVLEFVKNNGFPAKNEPGSQFIHIRVPKPSRMQLEEIGDDIIRRTNSLVMRLSKIKTNTGLRIRAAVQNEFIEAKIATLATKKIDTTHLKVESEGKFLGVLKRKQILGNYFQSTEKDDEIFIKKVNLYLKLKKNLKQKEIVKEVENQNN